MNSILELSPVIAVIFIVPTIVVPALAMSFLRANRRHPDYTWVCFLTLVAAAVWLMIALLYVGEAMGSLQDSFPNSFDISVFQHRFSIWSMCCFPAFPTFLAVLLMTIRRRRRRMF